MKTVATLLLCIVAVGARPAEPPTLKLTKTISLPGVKGRFDHFAIDVKGHRLFVAALGNNTLEVFDVATDKHLKSVGGLHKPTGVVFLSHTNQIGVANGDDGTFKLFDGASYQLLNSLRSLDDADNVRRDPKTTLIYVGRSAALGTPRFAFINRTEAMKWITREKVKVRKPENLCFDKNMPEIKFPA